MTDIEQKGRELAYGIVSDWLRDDSGTEIEQLDKLVGNLAAAIRSVAAEEREACAKIADTLEVDVNGGEYTIRAYEVAEAIRARGKAKEKP